MFLATRSTNAWSPTASASVSNARSHASVIPSGTALPAGRQAQAVESRNVGCWVKPEIPRLRPPGGLRSG
jgi:hypothetical protein